MFCGYQVSWDQPAAMGDMWRSQKMQLVQMIVQNDAAHAVVSKLGDLGKLEFRDVRAHPSRAVSDAISSASFSAVSAPIFRSRAIVGNPGSANMRSSGSSVRMPSRLLP